MAIRIVEGFNISQGINSRNGFSINEGISLFKGGTIIPPSPGDPCDWIDYEQVFELGGIDSTFVRNEINKQYSITTTGGDFKGFNFSSPANGFVSASSKVSFELEAVSITNQPSGGAVILYQDQPSPTIIAGFFNQAGTIVDANGGAPIGGATFQTGYIMGITFDFDAGTALASDNAFLSNTSLGVEFYAPDAPLYHGWVGASLAATTNIFSTNSGDRPFVLPQSDGVGFCNVVPIPPPVFCSPVTLTTQDGVPPNNIQNITVGGTNNLTITATSLGNLVAQSGAVANQVFNTQTEEVKIETRITSMTSTFTSREPAVGIGFFHNVLPIGSIPVLITNLAYIPSSNQVIGTNGTPYSVYPVPDYPTDLAIYLDPTPQQKKYAFQVNSDGILAGSVNVHGVSTGVAPLATQGQIAQDIVDSGFTDPNIESLTLGSPPNTVVITYKVDAGDYPESVNTTNCTSFENPPESQDFAEGKSQAKFYNSLNDLSWFLDIGIFSANYDSSQDVYMVISLDAGDETGESIVQTINFGSSAFELGEDAERWCNV